MSAAERQGLSPRVRGNLEDVESCATPAGSIPACAGESAGAAPPVVGGGVYPRVCGGIFKVARLRALLRGLSPRVRGNPAPKETPRTKARSIPACAGESELELGAWLDVAVYPRVCGGISAPARLRMAAAGLSPRVRGNLGKANPPRLANRSIPACAGESAPGGAALQPATVYPRVCGGIRPVV